VQWHPKGFREIQQAQDREISKTCLDLSDIPRGQAGPFSKLALGKTLKPAPFPYFTAQLLQESSLVVSVHYNTSILSRLGTMMLKISAPHGGCSSNGEDFF
jgi:hypothetical protein